MDGKPGYIYARLISQYEYQIGVKLYELWHCQGQLNTAQVLNKPHGLSSSLNAIPTSPKIYTTIVEKQ
ncbi:hypothetical protein RintRC_1730 [Richelia intracellularis]|nr:hypothetical protein RintRC_1730 [Richelia intracellularis]